MAESRLPGAVDARTREQLLELNRSFYAAHAQAFDQSRGDRPWPGWDELLRRAAPLPAALGSVLDLGCGNARFACFLASRGHDFRYTGVDANPELLAAAGRQLPAAVLAAGARLLQHDFLAGPLAGIGEGLPEGPFDWVVLMGVLHHVPGADLRLALLQAATRRLAPGGRLALATWQFASDPRQLRKQVPWSAQGPVLGRPIDPAQLETGDALLRFGEDPSGPPRYCHAVSAPERARWPDALALEVAAEFESDGATGDANHYLLLQSPRRRA